MNTIITKETLKKYAELMAEVAFQIAVTIGFDEQFRSELTKRNINIDDARTRFYFDMGFYAVVVDVCERGLAKKGIKAELTRNFIDLIYEKVSRNNVNNSKDVEDSFIKEANETIGLYRKANEAVQKKYPHYEDPRYGLDGYILLACNLLIRPMPVFANASDTTNTMLMDLIENEYQKRGNAFMSYVNKNTKDYEKEIVGQQVFIKPAMGVVNPDGSVYEPNIDIYFTRRITDEMMSIYSNMIQLQKDSKQDRSTVYSIHPERTSMNVYNVTTLQSHDKFISKVKELVEIFNDKEPYDHLYSHIEISIRHLWNFGDPRGGATRIYEQVIGNSSNLQNPKVIRSSGDYSTLEEFEVALKKALGNLGHTVRRSTKPENPNKSSKTFEVKFFN